MTIRRFVDSFGDRIISVDEALRALDEVVIFGAGAGGRYAKKYLETNNKEVLFFCDNDPAKQGTVLDSVKVVAPEELPKEGVHVCIASDWGRDIALQLKRMGVENYFDFGPVSDLFNGGTTQRWKGHFDPELIIEHLGEIEDLYHLLEDEVSRRTLLSIVRYRLTLDPACLEVAPYEEYQHPSVRPMRGDVIIDAGAWNGDTAVAFSEYLEGDCRIFSFEPEAGNYELLLKSIDEKGLRRIVTPVRSGLWNVDRSMCFNASTGNSMQFHIDPVGDEMVELVSLDGFLAARALEPDLIKMDIEGAEIEAISGAKETIASRGPRLQICVYHKADDLWKIPFQIRDINPGYRFYLGHDKQVLFETILYAETPN